MQELWGRRDLHLVGVLALRDITLVTERERNRLETEGHVVNDLSAGGICRRKCFTVKVKIYC